MDKKIKIVAGIGLAAGLTGGIYAFSKQKLKINEEKEQNIMFMDQYEDFEEVRGGGCAKEEPVKELLPIEVEKINGMIQGMSEQEVRVALRNIPVGLMFDEIGARLAAHEQFAMHIQDALNCLPR